MNPDEQKKMLDNATSGQRNMALEMGIGFNKPTWIKENLGKTEYYEQRAKDFEERNPDKKAPDYYREYGDKYVKRFDKLKPELSKEGQEWLEKTKDRLQFKMEAGLRSGEWDKSKPEELKEKAYDSHSEAYLEAGFTDLPQEDIDKIIKNVDRKSSEMKNEEYQIGPASIASAAPKATG
ncbi:MAG: hypothetical protein JEY79_03585 [Pseudodesulfovibrio sp.]|nr:hypothetical protein [Pseudodesulfovibrio sp.]